MSWLGRGRVCRRGPFAGAGVFYCCGVRMLPELRSSVAVKGLLSFLTFCVLRCVAAWVGIVGGGVRLGTNGLMKKIRNIKQETFSGTGLSN